MGIYSASGINSREIKNEEIWTLQQIEKMRAGHEQEVFNIQIA